MTVLHQELQQWAGESQAAVRVLDGMAGLLEVTVAGWPAAPVDWTGTAAVAFSAVEDGLRRDVASLAEAVGSAAAAHRELTAALEDAAVVALRAMVAGDEADMVSRTWLLRWEAWREMSSAGGEAPAPAPSPHDPGDEGRRRAAALNSEAERIVAEAASLFAGRIEAAAAGIPTGERRSFTEVASELGSGVAESVRGSLAAMWDLSTVRMVIDGRGWMQDVAGTARGLAAAVDDPGAAVRGLLDLDTWEESPARAIGHLVPDLAASAIGAGMAARAARTAGGVRRSARMVDVDGPPPAHRGVPAPPRPDEPNSPVINLTAVGDRMGDNARNITPIDGHTDVAIHGSPTAFGTTPDGPAMSPSDVAGLIAGNPKFDGGPIRLISCRSGASSCGPASGLADELGAEVLAPDTTVWVYPDGRLLLGEGRFTAGGLQITEPGEWIRFTPGER